MTKCACVQWAPTNPRRIPIMTNRTEQLKQLMADHDLTAEKVAQLLNRSTMTVRIWRCKFDGRVIPEHALELLKAKVQQ